MSEITISELETLIQGNTGEGVYRFDRRLLLDPDIFELEMEHIFEGSWLFLAHESQLPQPNDFVTRFMGRQPVIINRDDQGKLGGFVNTCSHRGANIVNLSHGNQKLFSCPFHGWCYKSSGELMSCGDSDKSVYPSEFDKRELGLKPVSKVESYRGFIFGSLSADVPALREHLGEAAKLIDLLVDQSPDGKLEILPGVQTYTYDGNWKLQLENGVDGFHFPTVHANYMQTVGRRQRIMQDNDPVKPIDVATIEELPGGFFHFGNGHVVIWNELSNPQDRPLYDRHEELQARVGEVRTTWMINNMRNLGLFPNVFLMDQTSTQIRMYRPITPDQTEVTTVCFAPVNESAAARERRIRQYEDFFNASGMATPDDLAAFNACQAGVRGRKSRWSDMSRRALNVTKGADDWAKQLGIKPEYSGTPIDNEALFHGQHRAWLQAMSRGMKRAMGLRSVA